MLEPTQNPLLAAAGNSISQNVGARRLCRSSKQQFLDDQRKAAAVQHLKTLPKPGYTLHCIMDGTYNAWDLVPAIATLAGGIKWGAIATLGFNRRQTKHLLEMLDAGTIGEVWFLCSEYYRSVEPATCKDLEEQLTKRGSKFKAMRTHAKIILADTPAGYLVNESSANLRSCNNIEQFALTHSAELFDFHKTWLVDVFT